MENHGATTFKGKPLTVIGKPLKIGDQVPDIKLLNNNLEPVLLSSYRGKVCIISSVPSLDTEVCDMETRRFNELANKLGPEVTILTISMDLPFAQKRWCGAAHIDRVYTFSDHRDAEFGKAFAVFIKELRLLARAVFVVDKEGIIRYVEYVKEMTDQPNYDHILKEVEKLI